jgi:hypothetical protein
MPTEKEAAEVIEKKGHLELFLIDYFLFTQKGGNFVGRLMFILS